MLAAMLLGCLRVSAHDFEVDGIYYNIASSTDLTVAVTFKGSSYSEYSNEYSGIVSIPESVTYESTTYSVTSIGDNAFKDCSSLTAITLPKGVTSIGYMAFNGCGSLTAISIPETLTSIEGWAFEGCSHLTSITLPENVESIGGGAFYGCSSLASINIPEKVTIIWDHTFYNCSSLTSIRLPKSLIIVHSYAFSGCSSLEVVTFGGGSPSLNGAAFSGCENIHTVINYSSLVITKGSTNAGHVAEYAHKVLDMNNLDNIQGFLFYTENDIHYLAGYIGEELQVVLPETYKGESYQVGDYAFEKCRNITSITISPNVSVIKYGAFSGCSGITLVNIPASAELTNIESSAFGDCSSLTSIFIPEKVKSIGYAAFSGCPLTAVDIHNVDAWCNIYFSDYRCNPLYYAKNLYLNGKPLTDVIISDAVVSIEKYAFYGCTNITSVEIGDGVDAIGSYAFYGCENIKILTMGSNVATIDKYAFRNCSNLISITLPESVTNIGDYAFADCSSLSYINIPEGVTSIGGSAFSGCNSLERVTINCVNVSNWFKSRTSIKEVILGNSVETIGESAFSGCTGMSDLTIGSSVATIGQKAFADCSNLMNIYALNPKAITCNENIFHTDAYNNATLYVPEGREQAYSKTTPWMKFYIQTLVVPEKSHSVTIGTAGYATLYLDYAVERPRGVEAYYVSRVSGDVAVLKAVWDYIPAHTGVILRGSAGTYTFAYTTAQVQSIPQNMLRGTTVDTEIPAEPGITYYALGRSDGVVGLYAGKIVDGCFFNNANKAYLPLPSDEGAGDTEQLARGLCLSFPVNTGVETMESAPETPALIYDLQGRRLTAITERGIYIVNGKKVVR